MVRFLASAPPWQPGVAGECFLFSFKRSMSLTSKKTVHTNIANDILSVASRRSILTRRLEVLNIN